ncbi:MAG: TetR/AcrR family transcriptional regulator [Acidimicrobiia bacterium]|nr:TetR/AcrR family transcriptional regulator [Acidimicrobiia bacterium]
MQEASDRRESRHERVKSEILDAAWDLARERGIGRFGLRELAATVGMKAPSLYQYFETKNDLYDSMYRSAYLQLRERLERDGGQLDLTRSSIKETGRRYFDFCVEDPARYSLIFDKSLPFTPSAESVALAEQVAEVHVFGMLADLGVEDEETVRLFIALGNGVVAQQHAYNPGGSDWLPVMDLAIDLFLDHIGLD